MQRQVLIIAGEDCSETLLRYMPRATLPAELGGDGDASHVPAGGIVPRQGS